MISSRGGELDHPENEDPPDACDYILTGVTLAIVLAERLTMVGGNGTPTNLNSDGHNGSGDQRQPTTTTMMSRAQYLATLKTTIVRQQSKQSKSLSPYGVARALQVPRSVYYLTGP